MSIEMKIYFRMFYLFKNGIIPKETWTNFCTKYLEDLMVANKDVLIRLKKGE